MSSTDLTSFPPVSPPRLSTGISGLDDILHGGLPSGQMYLVEGNPGSGKTTLAMQFILAGQGAGESGLYITLSEPVTELHASAWSHGWDANAIPIAEFVPEEASLSPEQQYTVFHPSEIELASTITKLTELIDRVRPERLVIDSLSELHLLAENSMRYRRQLLALKQFFAGRDITVLLLDDRTSIGDDMQLQSIAHGVLRLEKIGRSYGVTRRHIEIIKLRGSAFREGLHDYTIQRGGLVVYPRLIASEHVAPIPHDRILSGVDGLDTMFGGGLSSGSSMLITGPTGVGKSTIAMQYAYASACRGERAIFYSFDEVLRSLRERSEGFGMDIAGQIESQCLAIHQIDPAELSPGEFAWQIRTDVEQRGTRLVVIDSLNGLLSAMPGERDMLLHLHELISFLNQRGVATLLVLNQHGLVGSMQAPVDVSYLADTVLLLRYFEVDGEIHQVISVLKQRLGRHERSLRELTFQQTGPAVGAPLSGFRGVLTGVPEPIANGSANRNPNSGGYGASQSALSSATPRSEQDA